MVTSAGLAAALSLLAATALLLAGLALLLRARGRGLHAGVGLCLALSGLAQAIGTVGLRSWVPDTFLVCLGLVAELLVPASLFWVSALAAGASGSAERRNALWRAAIVSVLCLASALIAWQSTVLEVSLSAAGAPLVALGPLGRIVFGAHVVLLALGIAQVEALLRAVPDPLRYSLKFFLAAIVAPAAFQILYASQLLLLRHMPLDRTLPQVVLSSVALVLVALGLRAERAAPRAPLYVARSMVYGSVTFLVIGLYLVALGAVGELVRQAFPASGTGLRQVLVLIGLLALAVALLSRAARAEMRRFVSQRVYRSKYDYREKWLEVTDAFEDCRTVDSILDRLMEVLARTFGAGRLSVWLHFEGDDRFHEVRSLNLESPPDPLTSSHPAVADLKGAEGPVELGTSDPQRAAFVRASGAILFAPVRTQGELVGFLALGPDRAGEAYETDDRNLLRAIAHHAGVLLGHARLAEERRAAAELEALHRLSAFCVHDLKNLAASLSLVAKNAETHGSDPAFQESALKTVGSTAGKIMALVQKLSRRAPEAAPGAGPVDVDSVVAEALSSLKGAVRASVRREGTGSTFVATTRDELQQVVLNLVLNAVDALSASGASAPSGESIVVRTASEGDLVTVTVTDAGPGLTVEAQRLLFQPFRTTKSGGLGLGLYECKRIVEAHRGRIRVRSQPGQGTEFRVELPAWRSPPA